MHWSRSKLGNSNCVRVGEDVLALGSPLGLDQSLTRGIVSAINRVLPPISFALREPLIQIDTPLNPGNSGGPLLNRRGEVVGITTAIVPDAQNIGLAIPINLAKECCRRLSCKAASLGRGLDSTDNSSTTLCKKCSASRWRSAF